MLDGNRKSMQPMADLLGIEHQELRRRAVRAGQFVDPDALVIDVTGFPKNDKDSPVWHACTATRWARPGTVRSVTASRGHRSGPRPRSTGDCS